MATLVASFNYRHEAEYAKGFLDQAGVPSILSIDDAAGMQVGMAFSNPARLLVQKDDEAKAREVLKNAGVLRGGDPE